MKKPDLKSIFSKIKLPGFVRNHKIITIIIAVILIALVAFFLTKGKKQEVSKVSTTEQTVTLGNVKVEITGSGTIEANEQYDITSLVKGDVIADYFEEGDILEEDAVMYSIDASSMDKSIDKQKNSVSKAQTVYDNALEDVNNLTVRAPISGTVTEFNVRKGDELGNNTTVATIVDSSKMILKINFNQADAASLWEGASALVTLSGSSYTVEGTVTSVASGSVTYNGVKATPVEITINNPGTVKEGDRATAISCSVACLSEGTFEVYASETVRTKVPGDVTAVYARVGDNVTAGSTLVKMSSKTLEQNLENARLSLEDAQISLEDMYDNLDDYTIKAPISGTVISKTVKKGDKLDNSNSATSMAIIADMSRMLFTISVDELDISKIKEGQNVTITCDALDGKSFTGYVDEVSIVGTTNNSVTTYPVTVVVNDPEGLIPGMNVDASIAIEEKSDVLTVPISAIQRGNIVYVKNEDIKADQKKAERKGKNKQGEDNKNKKENKQASNPYEGYTPVRVEVGLSNNDVSEIVSGLYEGQRILVITATSSNNNQQQMGGMPGGMQGGMPGGMQGGNRSGGSYGGNRSGGSFGGNR